MPVVPITGYVRDREGNGIGDALVEVFAITDLASNAKGATPLASTYPDSQTGRYTLTVNTDNSSTGFVSTRITRGTTVRWVEGDAQFQVARFYAQHGNAPLIDNSVTDGHIGSRTVDQEVSPTGTGTVTHLINGLANRIRSITGENSWLTAPVATIASLNNKFAGSGTGAHYHTGAAGDGPKLSPSEALTWTPATADHLHDDRYALKDEVSSGGGDGGTADDSLALRGVHGLRFFQMFANNIPNVGSQEGVHKLQMGTNVVTTNSYGSAWINYPVQFPNATRWIMVTIGGGGYRGSVVPVATNRGDFEIRLGTDESRQVRINWWALGN